ncbi:phenylacetate--CoA ligase family protein [Marinobacter sp. R17]|uniref:phenylacetate--CoA ligase family protein n=1 Tax=Marinobacter sp. R17 TaxID=2484250 RepID=UPI000F4CD035|nr:phenylacetate--CoA ligase family protein [Marinobacter sp. R17]
MSKIIEWFYFKLPVWAQNILVSLYGLKLKRERYNKDGASFFEFLKRSQKKELSEILKLQEKMFLSLAIKALKTVPHYRNLARSQNIDIDKLVNIDAINFFPVLDKSQVKAKPHSFLCEKNNPKSLIKLNTSGTTGSPLTIYCTKSIRSKHYAFFSRLRSWFGLNPLCRRATIFGRIICPPDQVKPPFWRSDYFQNNLLLSSYHLSSDNLQYYYRKLIEYQPEEIIAYPSSLYQVARYINNNDLPALNVKLVMTTAETLMPYQIEEIRNAFNGPLVNQYGCTEMAFFASSCEFGNLHFHPEHAVIEVMDENGVIRSEGKGVLLATGLINDVMPLIRYNTGDIVEIASRNESCRCGRSFQLIRSIEGRMDDLVYKKDGTPVGRLDPVFKGGLGIEAAQIVQDEIGDIKVYVSPEANFNENNEEWLKKELAKRIGDDVSIEIIINPNLLDLKGSKFRSVIGRYNP